MKIKVKEEIRETFVNHIVSVYGAYFVHQRTLHSIHVGNKCLKHHKHNQLIRAEHEWVNK